MLCPLAVYKPVANHGGPMFGHLGLVLHVQEGNGSLYDYFNDPVTQVSSHLWLSKDGLMEQYVDTDVIAWAEAAGNEQYLSVETEGFATEPLTGAQVLALSRLLQWCEHIYQIPMVGPVAHGSQGFTPHCNPDGTPDPAWGNHTCPGHLRLAQMTDVLAWANAHPTQEDDMELYATNSHGTGFVLAADLSSKRGIPDAADAKNLIATGIYKVVALDDALLDAIPG